MKLTTDLLKYVRWNCLAFEVGFLIFTCVTPVDYFSVKIHWTFAEADSIMMLQFIQLLNQIFTSIFALMKNT